MEKSEKETGNYILRYHKPLENDKAFIFAIVNLWTQEFSLVDAIYPVVKSIKPSLDHQIETPFIYKLQKEITREYKVIIRMLVIELFPSVSLCLSLCSNALTSAID